MKSYIPSLHKIILLFQYKYSSVPTYHITPNVYRILIHYGVCAITAI